jgi:5-methylcytosine-specific restriction endonuclease McrA
VALLARQEDEPVIAAEEPGRVWWLYRDRVFRADDDLEADDVRALIHARDDRRRRTLERAHAELARSAAPPQPRRETLPRALRYAVWERDCGRCVQCGSGFELQYDHLIPVALGGATSLENLQLLCGDCNRAKGASLG